MMEMNRVNQQCMNEHRKKDRESKESDANSAENRSRDPAENNRALGKNPSTS